jgi:shikimate kinase
MNNSRNLILVGFMGTGKTHIGHELAKRLELTFMDMDDAIVERAGKPIPEIFADDGEAQFRSLERQLVIDIAGQTGLVVATGGGVVLNPANVQDFSKSGLVICLSATPEVILSRVEHDTNRPLLNAGDKMEKIQTLLASRQALYEAIPNQIDTSELNAEAVVDRILSLYR